MSLTVERDRAVARVGPETFRTATIWSLVLAGLFVFSHVWMALFLVPSFVELYERLGGELRPVSQTLVALSNAGVLPALVAAIDVAVFAVFYRLARKHGVGLLFAPLLVYLAAWFGMLVVLYMPMFDLVSQIR